VRLKGGDPLVFGRGSEEAQALAEAGVPFEIIPGVTAGVAAPAYAGIPVTHRGVSTSVTFITGHEDPSKPESQTDWSALARAGGTIVLYMGVKTLPRIAGALMKGGMAAGTPAAAVQWGTHARQRTVAATVSTIADVVAREGLGAPVITVIGDVVSLRGEIGWFEARPLFGRRIVVTRASAQAGTLRARLASLGAQVLDVPALRIEPMDPAPLRTALENIGDYSWLVLTSQNAVSIMWDVLRSTGRDARALASLRVACVGRSTADALLQHGIAADVTPPRFVAEAVLEELSKRDDVRGGRALYVAAEGAREVLPEGLRALGCLVNVVHAYRSVSTGEGAMELREALERGEVDLATFASASAVRGYAAAVGVEQARRAPAVSIGPVTSASLREAGIEPVAEADPHDVDGLVAAVLDAASEAAPQAD